MTQETIDRIQPLIDLYCLTKIKLDKRYQNATYFEHARFNVKTELETIIAETEKEIMRILFDANKELIKQIIQL